MSAEMCDSWDHPKPVRAVAFVTWPSARKAPAFACRTHLAWLMREYVIGEGDTLLVEPVTEAAPGGAA